MIDRVRKFSPIKEKLEAIIDFALAVRNISSTMESCNLIAHLNNPILVKELVDKLPNQYKLAWAMIPMDPCAPIVRVFSDWLYTIAEAASKVAPPVHTKKGASVNMHTVVKDIKKNCVICQSAEHKVAYCETFSKMTLDQRWNAVKQNNLCRTCLNPHRRKCFVKNACGVNECSAKHHKLLHNYQNDGGITHVANPVHSYHILDETNPFFRIIPVRIHSRHKFVDTFAFLDEGSSVTLLEKNIFDKMGLEGEKSDLCLKWTANTTRVEEGSMRTSIEVSDGVSNNHYKLIGVNTVSSLGLPTQSINMAEMIRKFPYLAGLPIASYKEAKPTLLIGLNNAVSY